MNQKRICGIGGANGHCYLNKCPNINFLKESDFEKKYHTSCKVVCSRYLKELWLLDGYYCRLPQCDYKDYNLDEK